MIGWLKELKTTIERNRSRLALWYQIIYVALLIIGVTGSIVCYTTHNPKCFLVSSLLFFSGSVCYVIESLSRRISLGVFLASFFLFLYGRMVFDLFEGKQVEYTFSPEISMHILLLLLVSLMSVVGGFFFYELGIRRIRKQQKQASTEPTNNDIGGDEEKSQSVLVRKISLYSFYTSALFSLLRNLEVIVFVQKHGYLSYFKAFTSIFPGVFISIASVTVLLFCVYCATLPSRREITLPFLIFLLLSLSMLLTGDRGGVVLNLTFVVFYFFWRNSLHGEVWITRKMVAVVLALLPFIVVGLSMYVYYREGVDVGEHTFIAQFIRFFKTAGRSVDIIGYEVVYHDDMPQKFYSIGGVIEFVKGNKLSKLLFNPPQFTPHTEQYANTTHLFSHAISFKISPLYYLEGHGKGSVYIAELFHDFSYLGTILGNVAIGVFLAMLGNADSRRPVRLGIMFAVFHTMPYIARGQFTDLLMNILSIPSILVLTTMFAIAKYAKVVASQIDGIRKRER